MGGEPVQREAQCLTPIPPAGARGAESRAGRRKFFLQIAEHAVAPLGIGKGERE
jgi:hypothetical protein